MTTTWTSDELSRIDAVDELEIAPRKRDGTLRKPLPIWAVRVGDDLYVRAAYGPATGWHRVARTSREARVRAGGVEKDVTIEDAGDAVNDEVDAAYKAKYRRYAANIVDSVTNEVSRSTTLKLVPGQEQGNP
jgi:hypothetical protein